MTVLTLDNHIPVETIEGENLLPMEDRFGSRFMECCQCARVKENVFFWLDPVGIIGVSCCGHCKRFYLVRKHNLKCAYCVRYNRYGKPLATMNDHTFPNGAEFRDAEGVKARKKRDRAKILEQALAAQAASLLPVGGDQAEEDGKGPRRH
jgi:hypothetical protein